MKLIAPLLTALGFCATEVGADDRADLWTSGIGLLGCDQIANVPEERLSDWVQGYWSGANLYLGGSDLCQERSAVSGLNRRQIRVLIEVQCARLDQSAIMFAAFQALNGLPKVEGSRAAKCETE